MTDESQLQVTRKDSSLSLSKVRSDLIARGRKDASILLAGLARPEPTFPPSTVRSSDLRKPSGHLIPGHSALTENFDSFRVRVLSSVLGTMAKLVESPGSPLAVSAPSEVIRLVKAWAAVGTPDDLSVSMDVFLKEPAPRPGGVERFFPAQEGNWQVEEFIPERFLFLPGGSIYFVEDAAVPPAPAPPGETITGGVSPGPDYICVGGYYNRVGDHYVWVPGSWVRTPV